MVANDAALRLERECERGKSDERSREQVFVWVDERLNQLL